MLSPVRYHHGKAHIERASLEELARTHATPLYVYSEPLLLDRCRTFLAAFGPKNGITPVSSFFAVKSNLNYELWKRVFKEGFGADVVSGGELVLSRKAGLPADRIVFSGVGETEKKLKLALDEKIHAIQVESLFELGQIVSHSGKPARISLRLNLDIDANTHPHITTATKANKFGITEKDLAPAAALLASAKNTKLVGLSCHLGSQIHEAAPFVQAAKQMVELGRTLKQQGHPIEFLSLGGGLGIAYADDEKTLPVEAYAQALLQRMQGTPFRLHVEPGRWIIGECGVLVTRVIGVKSVDTNRFVVADAGMNDLIRPALYGAQHPVGAVNESTGQTIGTLVGPVCETADTFVSHGSIPNVNAGDLLYLGNAGAYGMAMASNYNARPRAAELLVTANETIVIRQRETIEDLIPR